jgi:hypothetical protein
MPLVVVQLEQRIECGRLERELEQRSDELEQQCRFSRGLFKFKRRVQSGDGAAVVSLLGHAKRTHSLLYMLNLVKESDHAKDLRIPKGFRRCKAA